MVCPGAVFSMPLCRPKKSGPFLWHGFWKKKYARVKSQGTFNHRISGTCCNKILDCVKSFKAHNVHQYFINSAIKPLLPTLGENTSPCDRIELTSRFLNLRSSPTDAKETTSRNKTYSEISDGARECSVLNLFALMHNGFWQIISKLSPPNRQAKTKHVTVA